MTIKAGDAFPALKLKRLGADGMGEGMEEVSTDELFAGKKTVLFSVPGAFTPTCSAKHLPGFVNHAEAFKAKGVTLVCTAVNDAFVMKAWGKQGGAEGRVAMLPDGNAALVKALGLELDGSGFGMGTRGQRFALLIENGTVKDVQVEAPGQFEVSSAEYMLARV